MILNSFDTSFDELLLVIAVFENVEPVEKLKYLIISLINLLSASFLNVNYVLKHFLK